MKLNRKKNSINYEIDRTPRDQPKGIEKIEYIATCYDDIKGLSTYADFIVKIVNTESPIHVEMVMNRIRGFANYSRTGGKIKAAFNGDLNLVLRKGLIKKESYFLYSKQQNSIVPRDRSNREQQEKNQKYLSKDELKEAVIKVVSNCHGATLDEVISLSYDLLGFSRVTQEMKSRLIKIIEGLKIDNKIRTENEKIYTL